MRKPILALSIACAGALAFADNAQWKSTAWITGIGADASALDALGAANGSWTFSPEDGASFDTEAKSIVLDFGDDEKATFTVGDTAADEKAAQQLTITGVFTPCAEADIVSGTTMNEKDAQVGFAVVSSEEEATTETADDATTTTTTTVYKYYAWVGGTGGASSIADWVPVGECADATAMTTLTITLSYWGGSAKAQFTAKNGDGDAVSSNVLNLKSTAASANKVSAIDCMGSGSLSQLDGVTGIAVASVGDVSFGTVEEAIAAASAVGAKETTVKFVAEPSGNVTIPEGSTVKIDDNGQKAEIVNNGTMNIEVKDSTSTTGVKSGTYAYEGVKVSGSGKIEITLNDSSKEAEVATSDDKVTVTVQTKKDCLTAIKFADKAVTKDDTIAKFREFLTKNCNDVYTKANTSTTDIKAALEKAGGNTLPLWQSYALGIEPTVAVKATNVEAGKDTAETITLALPTIAPTGDYTVKIKVGDGTAKEYTQDVTTLSVPTATGKYPIVLSFE